MNIFKSMKYAVVLAMLLLFTICTAVFLPTASTAYLAKTAFTDVAEGTSTFAVSFAGGMQTTDEIEVWVNGVENTSASVVWLSGSTLQLVGYSPAAGDDIEFRRVSPKTDNLVDLEAGKTIRASSLMKNFRHVLQIGQEAVDAASDMLTVADDSVDAAIQAAVEAAASASIIDPEKHLYRVSNMFSLRSTEADTYTAVYLDGCTTANDGGQGPFVWDADSVLADNNGTVIQVTGVNPGRWVRQYTGPLHLEWFNILGDGITDITAQFQAVLDGLDNDDMGEIRLSPNSTYLISAPLKLNSNLDILVKNLTISGSGNSSVLKCNTADTHMISTQPNAGLHENITFTNFKMINSGDISTDERHCLNAFSIKNLKVRDMYFENTRGDGVYVRLFDGADIRNVYCKDTRRQGVAASKGNDITVDHIRGEGTMINLVDMEPNISDVLTNVVINDVLLEEPGIAAVRILGDGNDTFTNVTVTNVRGESFAFGGVTNGWVNNISAGSDLVFNALDIGYCKDVNMFNIAITESAVVSTKVNMSQNERVKITNIAIDGPSNKGTGIAVDILSCTDCIIENMSLKNGGSIGVRLRDSVRTKINNPVISGATTGILLFPTTANADTELNNIRITDATTGISLFGANGRLTVSGSLMGCTTPIAYDGGFTGDLLFPNLYGVMGVYYGAWPDGAKYRGDRMYYSAPSAGAYIGEVCVASGTPGTVRSFGAIAP